MNKQLTLQIVLVLMVGGLVAGQLVPQMNNDAVADRWSDADAYCDQQFDVDYDVYSAQVIGSHGGIHCVTDDGAVIHIHDVPDAELEHAHEEAAA